MFISRSPLRISLGGGGTDLPSYYSKFGGFFISAAINKYTYVSVSKPFFKKIFLKYSKFEEVENVDQIKNSLIRETLLEYSDNPNEPIEVNSFADVPSGTGLGSSGCFTVTFLRSLAGFYKKYPSQKELAETACKIEIDRLNEPVGKQDQYIAAFGGLSCFEIDRSGEVSINPIPISADTLEDLESNLLLFFTGQQREASSILQDQEKRSSKSEKEIFDNLHKTKELGKISYQLLKDSKLKQYALLMHEHWLNKRKRSQGMSNEFLDKVYDAAISNGALGGKLVGAGGGGFLMFYSEEKKALREEMKKFGLQEMKFKFDFNGVQPLLNQ
tara:strand:- start:803 stop:1789 length:987 start_codon:yes stop_codon:yes gene_type:complete